MVNKSHFNVHDRIEALRDHAINRLISGTFFLAIVGVPISISRAWFTGWQSAYTVHLIGLCGLTVILYLRNRLSSQARISIVFGMTFAVAIVGLLDYGIVGNGMVWALFSLLLCLFFIDNRTAAIVATFLSGVFILSMYRFVFAGREFPGSADVYVSSLSAWGTAYFGTAMFVVLTGVIIAQKRRQTKELLAELEHQNNTIEKQKRHIEHQANHDALTALPTLRLAKDRLEMAINLAKRADHKAALLFLDLDGFKAVNDTYGHDAGDTILKETASRILSAIRECDSACRIGGDEFNVILSKVEKTDDVAKLCVRLIERIGSPIVFGDAEIVVGVSIGVAIYPNIAKDAASMSMKADEAMYEVKKAGKNNYLFAES